MLPNKIRVASGFLLLAASSLACHAAGKAHHIVVMVWDGMRPDFISEETTPTLWRLRKSGVYFQNHHSVFVSSTEVNGTALGTGMNPRTSGIMANREYRPAIDPTQSVATEAPATIRGGDHASHERYLGVDTVAEILRSQPSPRRTAIAGTKQVVWLLDRKARPADSPSVIVAEGEGLPEATTGNLTHVLGSFPPIGETKIDRDNWTARAMLEEFWRDGVPSCSVLWLAEPDWSQHETGPGSARSLLAIRNSDAKLALVLDSLRQRQVLEVTDVLIVSDHGFSTIDRNVDVALDLSRAGLSTARAFLGKPENGSILVVGNGGSANLYVIGHDPKTIARAVEVLQQQDYTGVVFTRDGGDGTFPLSLARINSPEAPDIVVSFRWSDAKNSVGTPGMLASEIGARRKPGGGMHASLSRYDLHNTLVAAGPDFLRGVTDPLPSGNIDIAPTVLWLLGVTPPQPMEGRVLSEALSIPGPKLESFETKRHEVSRRLMAGNWRQYLTVSQVNGVAYFDEGDGEWMP